MKIAQFVLALLFFTTVQVFSQNGSDTISGVIKEVKPHFAGQHTIVVGETELVLLTNPADKTQKTFEINKQYKDLLVDEKGTFVLNPKYANKPLLFTYTINGKGWKCIKSINAIKK